MRSIALVVMLVAACADSRFGAYLIVEGDDKIAFDRLEFYFGDYEPGFDVPTSPKNPTPVQGLQFLNTRIYDPHDSWVSSTPGSPQREFTYYVPTGGSNDQLVHSGPSYVMVVAYNKDKAIGIAEEIGFKLSDNEVDRYIIHLLPFAAEEVEMWGFGQPDCIKWTHQRATDPSGMTSVVAVVRDHDRDCDGYSDAEDCNRLIYCDFGTQVGCGGAAPCIATTPCAIGECAQIGPPGSGTTQSCSATTCLFDGACSTSCDPTKPIDERLQCAFSQVNHPEVYIPLDEMEQLCTVPYSFDLQIANALCASPRIIYPLGGREPDGFVVTVAPGTAGDSCHFELFPPMFGDPTFHDNDDHVLVAVDPSAPGVFTRTTFLFGIHPGSHDPNACPSGISIQNTSGSSAAICN